MVYSSASLFQHLTHSAYFAALCVRFLRNNFLIIDSEYYDEICLLAYTTCAVM